MFDWLTKWFTQAGKSEPSTPISTVPSAAERVRIPAVVVEEEVETTDEVSASRSEEAPWDLGGCVSGLDQEQLQIGLIDLLSREWDNAQTQPEREFLEALTASIWVPPQLPAFPAAAQELDELLGRGREPTMMDVVRVIEHDPALVQRVWTRASSAEFVVPPKGLHFAISRIGFDELWRMAIQVCLQSSLFQVPGFQDSADRVRLFGLVSAIVSSELYGERRGVAYLAGLLHDVGKLLVYRHATPELVRHPRSEAMVERLAQCMHPSFGVIVAKEWQLGDEVAAALGYHHDPFRAPKDKQRLARTVRVANLAVYAVEAELRGLKVNPRQVIRPVAEGIISGVDPVVVARRAWDTVKKMI